MGFADRLRLEWDGTQTDVPGRLGFAAWDLVEQEPVTLGADRPVHPASTIKVLVMIAALRRVRDGALSLDSELELPVPGARAAGSGVLHDLRVRRLSLADMIMLMIVISDNAATNAVIDAVSTDVINECGAELGCRETVIERRLMEPNATGRLVSTALDQARVLSQLANGAALPPDLTEFALDVLARQQIRDRLPARLPESAWCWNKTGELLGVRHDVGLIGRHRPRAVVAVLVDDLTDITSTTGYKGGPACDAIAELGLMVHRALD